MICFVIWVLGKNSFIEKIAKTMITTPGRAKPGIESDVGSHGSTTATVTIQNTNAPSSLSTCIPVLGKKGRTDGGPVSSRRCWPLVKAIRYAAQGAIGCLAAPFGKQLLLVGGHLAPRKLICGAACAIRKIALSHRDLSVRLRWLGAARCLRISSLRPLSTRGFNYIAPSTDVCQA